MVTLSKDQQVNKGPNDTKSPFIWLQTFDRRVVLYIDNSGFTPLKVQFCISTDGKWVPHRDIFEFFSSDGDKMAPSVEKKIAELEMGLLHLQQNIDIPEITLTIHPTVASVIKKCAEEGRKPKVADFGDKVEDATFLNALQSGVNRWIREIQKVCTR